MKDRILQIMPIVQKLCSSDANILGMALVENDGQTSLRHIGIDVNGSLKLIDDGVRAGINYFHCR
jgi:hypothetical protein